MSKWSETTQRTFADTRNEVDVNEHFYLFIMKRKHRDVISCICGWRYRWLPTVCLRVIDNNSGWKKIFITSFHCVIFYIRLDVHTCDTRRRSCNDETYRVNFAKQWLFFIKIQMKPCYLNEGSSNSLHKSKCHNFIAFYSLQMLYNLSKYLSSFKGQLIDTMHSSASFTSSYTRTEYMKIFSSNTLQLKYQD